MEGESRWSHGAARGEELSDSKDRLEKETRYFFFNIMIHSFAVVI